MQTCVQEELKLCSYMQTCVQEELKLCSYMQTCVQEELKLCSYMQTCVQEELKLCSYIIMQTCVQQGTAAVYIHADLCLRCTQLQFLLNTSLHIRTCTVWY